MSNKNFHIKNGLTVGTGTNVITSAGAGTFTAATISGDLTVDTDSLKVDSSSGHVGLGTTSPAVELHIKDTGGLSRIRLEGTASAADNFEFGQGTTGVTNAGFEIYDVDSSAARFNIDTNGNIGIGTQAPSMKLNISHADQDGLRFNTTNTAESFIDFGDTDDNDVGRISYDHADNQMAFRTNATEHLTINSDGYTTIARSGADYGLQIRSSSNRSGLVIDKPGTSTIMGSALVVAADERFKLGTASYYHIEMKQNGDTKINSNLLLADSFGIRAYSGYFSGGTSTGTFDFDTYGAGCYEVTAAFGHYGYIPSYGCFKKAICSNGAGYSSSTSINVTEIATEIHNSNGGRWHFEGFDSSNVPSGMSTTGNIRVRKAAGSYGGGGYYFVEVRGNQSA